MNHYERETVVNASDGDDLVHILTHQRRFFTRLRKDPRFTEVGSGFDEGTEYAEFVIPANQWNPVTGAKRRVAAKTEQQKESARRRMAYVRAARSETSVSNKGSGAQDG